MKSIKFDIVRAECPIRYVKKKRIFSIPRTWYLHCNSFRITVHTDLCLMCAVFGRKMAYFFLLLCCYRLECRCYVSVTIFSFPIFLLSLYLLPSVLPFILNKRSLFAKSTFSLSALDYKGFDCIYTLSYLWFVINFSYIRYILLRPNLVFHLLFGCLSSLRTIFFLLLFSSSSFSFASMIYSSKLDCIFKSLFFFFFSRNRNDLKQKMHRQTLVICFLFLHSLFVKTKIQHPTWSYAVAHFVHERKNQEKGNVYNSRWKIWPMV